MSILLLQLGDVFRGEVIKRPSKHCKTPYVADVQIENGDEILGHSLSLGCCGLADKGSEVLMTIPQSSNSNRKAVCSHRIDLSLFRDLERNKEIVIGINPKIGENIAEEALKNNCMRNLENIQSYTREVKIMNSRFDFAGIDENGKPFLLEVKNVPLADYVDVPKKERNNYIDEIKNKGFNEKIAYFPDGYRKKSTDVVSPRALKHIQELEEIAKKGTVRTILCFIIQRSDANRFQTSNVDLIYKKAVYQAHQNGVEINTIQVDWNKEGECHFVRNDLPISLKNGEFIPI